MWNNGPFEFESSYVVLCEGLADKNFLRKLIAARGLPEFDFPWPISPEERNLVPVDTAQYWGRDQFGQMLLAIDNLMTLKPELETQIQGILIVTDARDNREESFQHVCRQIEGTGRLRPPPRILQALKSSENRPSIAVMLLPFDGHGSLETVCLPAMRDNHPDVYKAMETYLSTPPIQALTWPAEKRDKSKLQCVLAATNRRDPTMSLQYAFSGDGPVIDVNAECFDEIAAAIRAFCDAVGRPAAN